ncbi:MAG: NUDIX hydrolase [Caldilineaceae bacterium]|nr:NUDIX hydrolase [Caldilineaceae bacterium]MCB9138006.1 NUDIX hydrolase [Caldilineaceae bacterium]
MLKRGNASTTRRPVVCETEVQELVALWGEPLRRTVHIPADNCLRGRHWRHSDSDRRAEVVFVLEDPDRCIWVHAKRHYPARIYRLPTGGIHWSETVIDALYREVDEETGWPVNVKHFLGILEYYFHDGENAAHFASYIFYLACPPNEPTPHAEEQITEFRRILPSQLPEITADLRNLLGDRRCWGQFRAHCHDLVHEALTG